MKLDEIVTWYQKKIGTYDKQQWEKTVEQKILDGLSSVTLKTAKLKTELIDVDLVRGSTFPKAKPKQSLLTVIRLAILRYFFLPVYAQWWVKQTSPNTFGVLLFLYITQMVAWAVYAINISRIPMYGFVDAELSANKSTIVGGNVDSKPLEDHIVSLSELLIPMGLSLFLSLIHSQIVATNTASGAKSNRRRFSNTNLASKQIRLRKRKKLKNRGIDSSDSFAQRRRSATVRSFKVASMVNVPSESTKEIINNTSNNEAKLYIPTIPLAKASTSANLKLDLRTPECPLNTNDDGQNVVTRKRSVNWDSPIHNYAVETQEKEQQTSPQQVSSSTTSESNTPINMGTDSVGSGASSNNSAHVSPAKTFSINNQDEELENDGQPAESSNNIRNGTVPVGDDNRNALAPNGVRRNLCEDDGFESLNGKSSSGEDNIGVGGSWYSMLTGPNQLRSRFKNNETEKSGRFIDEKKHCTVYRRKVLLPSASESDGNRPISSCDAFQQTLKSHSRLSSGSSDETDGERDDCEIGSSPASINNSCNYNECTTSATEWLGVTTNSDDCSYSSEMDNTDAFKNYQYSEEDAYDVDFTPNTILNSHDSTDRISCTIWDQREIKKAQMSVLEISSCIIERVESMPETNDYIYIGICFSVLLSLIPCFCRLCEVTFSSENANEINYFDVPLLLWQKASYSFTTILRFAFGETQWERTVLIISLMQRLCLTTILFIIFAVAERTFKQKFLYAKLFSHLTSSRRARKSNLPHFRLNKVRNIKTWLSVRSYLKKRGPQRSVDIIVSAAFIITLLLLAFLSVEWLKDSVHLHSQLNLEALFWSITIGIFLLRFMTLGNKIHIKYRSVSVLITEQINLYLQIEQKPKKKEELMVSNSVLKLAADLLKELESPFKISGLSANPYLFTTIKVVILSALSGVLSEMLGFKLKLHKIKIK